MSEENLVIARLLIDPVPKAKEEQAETCPICGTSLSDQQSALTPSAIAEAS